MQLHAEPEGEEELIALWTRRFCDPPAWRTVTSSCRVILLTDLNTLSSAKQSTQLVPPCCPQQSEGDSAKNKNTALGAPPHNHK